MHVSLEGERVRHPIERRLRRRELEGGLSLLVAQHHVRLFRKREDIGVLVVRHAEARPRQSVTLERDSARCRHQPRVLIERGVVRPDREPVARFQLNTASELQLLLVFFSLRLASTNHVVPASAVTDGDLDAQQFCGAAFVGKLTLGLDQEVLPRAANLLDDIAGTFDDRFGIDPRRLTDSDGLRTLAHRGIHDHGRSDSDGRSQQTAPLLPFHELDNRITVRSPFWVLGSPFVFSFTVRFWVRASRVLGSRCFGFELRRCNFYIGSTGYRSQEPEPSHDDLLYSQDISAAYAVPS